MRTATRPCGAWNLIRRTGLARRMDRQDAMRSTRAVAGRWLRLNAAMVTWGGVVSVLTVTVLTVSLAYADEGGGGKAGSEFLLLVQISLLIGVGRGLGEVMQRLGQPS